MKYEHLLYKYLKLKIKGCKIIPVYDTDGVSELVIFKEGNMLWTRIPSTPTNLTYHAFNYNSYSPTTAYDLPYNDIRNTIRDKAILNIKDPIFFYSRKNKDYLLDSKFYFDIKELFCGVIESEPSPTLTLHQSIIKLITHMVNYIYNKKMIPNSEMDLLYGATNAFTSNSNKRNIQYTLYEDEVQRIQIIR